MNKQKEIISTIAKRHGLTLMQAEEIWRLFGAKIADVIGKENKKNLEELYDIENFPVIHIDNFGKFFPSKRVIHHSNTNLKKKITSHEHNI
jgi:nucleoid DNA-binding protein